MTKFEEEVKRPDNTGIEPFSKRDVDFSKLAAKFARAAQTLKKWREYAGYLGDKLNTANHNLYLETEQSAAYHAEIVELKRENQRLVAENLAVKTLVDNAKPQQALPVVPECVAEWIEILKSKGLKPLKNPETYGETGFTEEKLQNIVFWIFEHQEDYMRAWLDGYTVEKPQLFEVEFLTDNYDRYLLMQQGDEEPMIDVESTNEGYYKQQFTEQEIKSINEKYMEFAVPVEDGK